MQRRPSRGQSSSLARIAVFGLAAVAVSGCVQPIPHVDGIEVTVTDDSFQKEVLESEFPVLVDFGATWCGPCRHMEPVVAQMSLDYRGKLKVAKLDIDESPDSASKHNVSGIPTFILFEDGKEVDRTVGGRSEEDLTAWVEEHL